MAPYVLPTASAGDNRAVSPDLSRNTFVALVVLLAATAATARGVPDAEGAVGAVVQGLWTNKVLWLCLGVGLWHLVRVPSPVLGVSDLAAACPALLLSTVAGGIWPWLGLLPPLLAVAVAENGVRTGPFILLLAVAHEIVVSVVGELSGDALLAIDARIAGFLAGWFLPGITVDGNALQQLDGHMLVLVWGCSSLSNLGDALLLFCALVSLCDADAGPAAGRLRFTCYMLLLAASTIALNGVRLGLMASNAEIYAYLHEGTGAAWFRTANLGITAFLSWVSVR